MIIFIEFKKVLIFLLILGICIFLSLSIFSCHKQTYVSVMSINEPGDNQLFSELKRIINLKNQALLSEDLDLLAILYNHDIQSGVWAYEHQLTRLEYLHNWSDKQGVEFIGMNSYIDIVNSKEKDDGFSLTLLVSTEYKYVYNDRPEIENDFRIGHYQYLDLMSYDNELVITKEWYEDPFADSLHLDEISNKNIKDTILSNKPKDLSHLNEKRVKAVDYADRYIGTASLPEYGFYYNPEYRNYNSLGGDCTNFASQVLHEGGGFTKNSTWNYEKGSGTKAWVNASAFNDYMLYSGRASKIAYGTYSEVLKNSYDLLPGDYIAYEKKGKVKHISIVTGIDSKGYVLVNSHNADRYRVPWDLGWSDEGIKFWLLRVQY